MQLNILKTFKGIYNKCNNKISKYISQSKIMRYNKYNDDLHNC